MEKLKLSNNLAKFRKEKGLSQTELAQKVGTTRQTIISIEKKQFITSVKLALLLALALDTKVEELFFFE